MLRQMNMSNERKLNWQGSSGNYEHFTLPSNDLLYITVPFDSSHFTAF